MKEFNANDYSNYRIQRAKESIIEVETLIENRYWNTAINRMYYACFYAVGALLVKNNIEASTHAGTRQKFGQSFVKTGIISRELAKHYTTLFEQRQKGDYNDFFDFDEQTVKSQLPLTKNFIVKIEELLNA